MHSFGFINHSVEHELCNLYSPENTKLKGNSCIFIIRIMYIFHATLSTIERNSCVNAFQYFALGNAISWRKCTKKTTKLTLFDKGNFNCNISAWFNITAFVISQNAEIQFCLQSFYSTNYTSLHYFLVAISYLF